MRIAERLVLTLTACFGLATVARIGSVERRRRVLEAADARLEHALITRAHAYDRERRARAAAEQAGELQERFLATVSHELRTPLNAIVGWAHIMKSAASTDSHSRRAIEGIERNARAQATLITDLLDMSQLIRGRLPVHMAATDLRRAVGQAVAEARPVREIFRGLLRAHGQDDARTGGLGFGLTIVRACMDAAQGSVRVDSTEGRGASVTLTWPVTLRPAG